MKFSFNFNFGNNSSSIQSHLITEEYLARKYFLTLEGYLYHYPNRTPDDYEIALKGQLEMASHMFLANKTILIEGARGYGKSEIALTKIVHILYHNPTTTFLIQKKTSTGAKDFVGKIARVLKDLGVKLENDAMTSIRLEANKYKKEPSVIGLGLGSELRRGMHPDFILCDDIITIEQTSEPYRIQAKLAYDECLSLSKNITTIGQRCHNLDIYGELATSPIIYHKKYYYGSIPACDKDMIELKNLKVSQRTIQANYFGTILPNDHEPFTNLKVGTWERFTADTIASIDPAFGGGDKIGISIGRYNVGRKMLYAKCFGIKDNIFTSAPYIVSILKENRVSELIIEVNKQTQPVYDIFQKLCAPLGIRVGAYVATENKELRIETNVSYFANNLMLYANDDINDIKYWSRLAKTDDIIDSLAQLCHYVKNKYQLI